ncbi:unnamed protein product [Spirodela intermedia]|uniref:HTH myb-type domain-containing protein n=1 Tax=Spirodela intermedia TaxID=51605 RepID=A0A7I8J8C9_SPIIN|nr:unnamed protein product [Spirodela intermedia]CAA6666324.1 unnamed protein product [Spirodela intermedia]
MRRNEGIFFLRCQFYPSSGLSSSTTLHLRSFSSQEVAIYPTLYFIHALFLSRFPRPLYFSKSRFKRGTFRDRAEQLHKLEDFLARLEEERLKIEAFKRELPLCLLLLDEGNPPCTVILVVCLCNFISNMDAYGQQLEKYHTSREIGSALEEFIPIEHARHENLATAKNVSLEKTSWMTRPISSFYQRTRQQGRDVLPDITIASAEKTLHMEESSEVVPRRDYCGKDGVYFAREERGKGIESTANPIYKGGYGQRKIRRCWSPDLHRRFINALQILGGSRVATPKQIREMMKVDGLTNDEVESHLQKYRLHARRPESEEYNWRITESSTWMSVNEKALFPVREDAELSNHSNNVALMF